MAKSTTPKEEIDLDAIELPDEEIDLDLDLESVRNEALKNPDLYAFLTGEPEEADEEDGGGPKKATVVLFRGDPKPYSEAKQEHDDIMFRAQHLRTTLESKQAADELNDEERAEFEKNLAEFDAELVTMAETVARRKEKLFNTAIVVKLQAPHKIAIEKAERRARKASPNRRNDEEAAVRFNKVNTVEVLARTLTSVVLPGGKEVLGDDRLATAKLLDSLLPSDQMNRLADELNKLVYTDQFRNLALSDPGFLAAS